MIPLKKRRTFLRLVLSLLCTVLLVLALGIAFADTRITVSPASDARIWEGWGTSLCWWANRLGYSDTLAQQAADLFFGDQGLNMNIMRYNIGGGDDPSHNHITRTDSAVPGWLAYDETSDTYVYDVHADYRQLNVLSRAVRAAGEDALVEVFSNSPPYFMTVSGCTSGAVRAEDNNLREDAYEAFADYLATVTSYIQHDLDIPVASLSPMNEPDTDYWQAYSPKQEGCHTDPGQSQSDLIVAVSDALARHQLDNVLIAASDETSPRKQLQEYNAYSPEAKKAVGRINTHTYNEKDRAKLGRFARENDLALWMSEVDGDGTAGKQAGEMGAALWLGKKIISDITLLSPSAWVMWQVIDNHISAEGFNGNTDYGMVDTQGGFWGAAVADHDQETIILTQKYYGLGQFTRYIRPGSTIIPCSSESLAAYDPKEHTLTLVLLNTKNREHTVSVDLSAFSQLGASAKVIRTSGSMAEGEHWAQLGDLPISSSSLNIPLAPNSITTLVLDSVLP